MKKRLFIKSLLAVVVSFVYTFSQMHSVVYALDQPQKDQQIRGSKYFDLATCDTGGGSSEGGGTISTTGETTGPAPAVQKVFWDILTSNGIDEIHTAAIMGSIANEGAWHPMNVGYFPNNFDGKDPSVPKAVDEGYGLIGWTPGTNLLEDMKTLGLKDEKPYTAETQAKVVVGYLQNKTNRYSKEDVSRFLGAKTLSEASVTWIGGPGWGFERPGDNGAEAQQVRLQSAKQMLRKFKGSTAATLAAPTAATPSGGSSVCCPASGDGGDASAPSGPITLRGKNNAEKIFNYLVDYADLTDNQAAGAVGVMMLESGGNTLNLDPTAENPKSHAYGIAQWLDSRKTGLQAFADEKGGPMSDLVIQAQYLKKEMEDNINGYENEKYKKINSLKEAVIYWTDYFEGLLNDSDQQIYDTRTANARKVLNNVDGGDDEGNSTGEPVSASTNSTGCACTENSGAVSGKTVVIDPGHGPSNTKTDSATGLKMVESDNQPEGHDVWEVAQKVKKDLTAEGYNVILTKKSEDDSTNFRERAKVADTNHAALALSIHGDPGLPDPGQIYVQKVGLYRGSGGNKTTFKDAEVAKKSQQYAEVFKEERQKAEGGNIVIKDNSFDGRVGLEPGNIPMVQLFSKTPWVYNERKMSFDKDKYAEGLENSIKKILGSGAPEEKDGPVAATLNADAGGDIKSLLDDLAKKNGGQTSISVQSINGNTKGDANGDIQMPTRSSYKIYTAYATLRAIQAGKVSWNTRVTAPNWSGTIRDTMSQMIIYSNNDAAEALRLNNKIGSPSQVTSMLRNDVGLSGKTVMGSGDAADPHGSNSRSTSNDFNKFLIQLYQHKLKGVSKDEDYKFLIDLMKKASTDNGGKNRAGIAAGVGSQTEVADKPGWAGAGVDQASNDVGIVYLKDNPYAISILTDKPNQWDGVANIAKGVNDLMSGASAASCDGAGAVPGDLQATVKNYAYADDLAKDEEGDVDGLDYNASKPKSAYKKAFDAGKANGQYTGGGYTDCGAFVTRSMIDSGYEPNYNYSGVADKGASNTVYGQLPWLKANWQKISVSSTKDLQPGDVAINTKHTYLYVGQIDGFKGNSASASWGGHVPVALDAYSFDSFEWYRIK